ncbi:MAG: T9SS type A sorting domain-containing protein [Candidatus Cloacimonadota bacterium]|nr:MAG: T9SS type A sorting domain-containing protein [Candidatus Cloacimonadota bacterium]
MDSIPDWKKTGSYDSDLGRRVTVGDFNNDGYGDIAVANPTVNVDGMVYIFYGSPNPDTMPDVILVGEDSGPFNSLFGCEISGGFDINGDEYDDLIVGSEGYNVLNGKVYVFFGGNLMDSIPDLEFGGPGGFFGDELGMLGDIDGDNYGDFAVGRSSDDTILIYRGANNLDSLYDYVFADVGLSHNNWFGSFDGVGPLFPGDQNRHLLVGARNYGDSLNGKVYLFQGGSPFDTICDAFAIGGDGMHFGYKVADAGDVNGDGRNEIIFSDRASNAPDKVWICKYVGPGIEEVSNYQLSISNEQLAVCPNPFTTVISVQCQVPSDKKKMTLQIYDVSGRLVKSFSLLTPHPSPITSVTWDGRNDVGKKVTPAIYFAKLSSGDFVAVEKIILVK